MRNRLLLLVFGVTLLGAARTQADSRVLVLDTSGKRLATAHSIKLNSQRLAVPATVFRLLGLSVGYAGKERRLYISVPETDIMVGLRTGEHRSYHPEVGYLSTVYSYPLARKRGGHFYVSVRFMQQAFPDYFTSTWDNASQTLTLKRRQPH